MPVLKNVLLPAAEEALSAEEYDALMEGIWKIEKGLEAAGASAMAAKLKAEEMSPDQVQDYLSKHGLMRD